VTLQATWDDLRRLFDEVELQIHLGSMDARERWRALQPRITKLEHAIQHETEHARHFVADEVATLGKTLRELRDEVADNIAIARRG